MSNLRPATKPCLHRTSSGAWHFWDSENSPGNTGKQLELFSIHPPKIARRHDLAGMKVSLCGQPRMRRRQKTEVILSKRRGGEGGTARSRRAERSETAVGEGGAIPWNARQTLGVRPRDASTPFRPRLRPRRNSAQHDLDFEHATLQTPLPSKLTSNRISRQKTVARAVHSELKKTNHVWHRRNRRSF